MTKTIRGRLFSTKTLIRVAFAALSLGVGVAHAQSARNRQTAVHPGPYDNTGNSLDGRYVGGGGNN